MSFSTAAIGHGSVSMSQNVPECPIGQNAIGRSAGRERRCDFGAETMGHFRTELRIR
jgi:hypothetical protein